MLLSSRTTHVTDKVEATMWMFSPMLLLYRCLHIYHASTAARVVESNKCYCINLYFLESYEKTITSNMLLSPRRRFEYHEF